MRATVDEADKLHPDNELYEHFYLIAWNKYCYVQIVFDNYHKKNKNVGIIYIKKLSRLTLLTYRDNTEIALKYVLNYILKNPVLHRSQ